nr:conserved hypothetical protein, periplasmic binding protein family [uncultured archaeon]
MKTNLNKLLTAIMLCSVLLVALPGIGIAAAQEGETLDIYGNANEDDIIDMRDLTFTARIILRLEDPTDLADANYDGRISVADMTQIGLIILGRESKLTFVDYDGVVETVHMPLNRIVTTADYHAEACRIVGAKDRIVGVDEMVLDLPVFFPDLSELPSVGSFMGYDIETILELEPDAVILAKREWLMYSDPELEDKIEDAYPGIDVFVLMPRDPDTIRGEMMKFGYLFDGVESARNYVEWSDDIENEIMEYVSGIPEDEKTTVFMDEKWGRTTTQRTIGGNMSGTSMIECEPAGGINICADLPGNQVSVEVEWLLDQNPDVIIGSEYGLRGYETDDISSIKTYYEEIIGLPGFKEEMDAVKNGRVHIIDMSITRGCKNLVGTAYMAKWFYPDIPLDPIEIHQNYLDEFCGGLDYDVREHGIFVYPPLEES